MNLQRVVFINRFFWPDHSATAQILTQLAPALRQAGYDVQIVTSRLGYADAALRFPQHEQFHGVQIHRLQSTGFGRGRAVGRICDYLTFYVAVFCFLLRRVRPHDIVVVKTDPPLLSILGYLAKQVIPFRLVSWCQDIFPEVATATMRPCSAVLATLAAVRLIRDMSLQGSDQVVVLGADMCQFVARCGVDPQRIAVIPNMAVQPPAASSRGSAALRREWGISESAFVVAYSGNLGQVHDFLTLREAARELAALPDLVFLVIGDGIGYRRLRALTDESDPDNRFLFLPYQPIEDLAASLAVADIHWFSLRASVTPFVYPSKLAGILQAGKPVLFIGDSRCAIAALIRTANVGIAVSEGDSAALSAGIRQYYSDRHLLAECACNARRLWLKDFAFEGILLSWTRLISSLNHGKF